MKFRLHILFMALGGIAGAVVARLIYVECRSWYDTEYFTHPVVYVLFLLYALFVLPLFVFLGARIGLLIDKLVPIKRNGKSAAGEDTNFFVDKKESAFDQTDVGGDIDVEFSQIESSLATQLDRKTSSEEVDSLVRESESAAIINELSEEYDQVRLDEEQSQIEESLVALASAKHNKEICKIQEDAAKQLDIIDNPEQLRLSLKQMTRSLIGRYVGGTIGFLLGIGFIKWFYGLASLGEDAFLGYLIVFISISFCVPILFLTSIHGALVGLVLLASHNDNRMHQLHKSLKYGTLAAAFGSMPAMVICVLVFISKILLLDEQNIFIFIWPISFMVPGYVLGAIYGLRAHYFNSAR